MTAVLATLLGTAVGLLAAIPGLHIAILIAALLAFLPDHNQTSLVFVAAALGSSTLAGSLAKTFHPANSETLASATPELKMAYEGRGLEAIRLQVNASCSSMIMTCGIGLLFLLFSSTSEPKQVSAIVSGIIQPVTAPLLLLLAAGTVYFSKRKLLTLVFIVLATAFGYIGMNAPALKGNPHVLTPILSGLYTFGTAGTIFFSAHAAVRLPKQVRPQPVNTSPWPTFGTLAGVITSFTAGLGASALTATSAKHTTNRSYLELQAGSEAANNTMALLLLVVLGTSRSGAAAQVQQHVTQLNWVDALSVISAIFVALLVAYALVQKVASVYAHIATNVPPKTVLVLVCLSSLALIINQTGTAGLGLAVFGAALGMLAKKHFVPNQALTFVIGGPVLLHHTGLVPYLPVW